MKQQHYEVIVAGAGVGGVSAAVAAARAGANVLLIEAGEVIGGTGVHSPVGLVCNFRDSNLRPINTGLHCEFFPDFYESPALFPAPEPWCGPAIETYDHRQLLERYQSILAAEKNLTVCAGTRVVEAAAKDGQLQRVRTEGREVGWLKASVWIDSTADGNLSALATATVPSSPRRSPLA
jgi:flavin-dependent dehydrogenase